MAARSWRTWALTAIYFTTFGGFIALTAWLPTYWTALHGQDLARAGLFTALFSLTCSLLRVAGGGLSDRFGGERTLALSLLVILAGSLVMALARTPGLAALAEFTMALGMGVGNAAVFKLVPVHVSGAVGGAAGIVGGLGAFGGFAIPPAMGLLARALGTVGYAWGFLLFSGLALVSLALTSVLPVRVLGPAVAGLAGANGGALRRAFSSSSALFAAAAISVTISGVGAVALHDPVRYAWIGNQTGYAPVQPVEFSHRLHAKDCSIPCEYCHFGARRGPVAGIPAANVCMNCHAHIGADLPEVKKVATAIETGRPIAWVRLYDLQDFVYFDHSAHVNQGVACQQCHGPVQEMARVEVSRPFTMGWCVGCHREYAQRSPASAAGLPKQHGASAVELPKQRSAKAIRPSAECSACHF